MPLAVKTADVATPGAFVTTVVVPPADVPLSPVLGGANVTVTSGTGLPLASLTVATSSLAKAVSIAALRPFPTRRSSDLEGPVVLVSEKPAGVDTPGADALTV